MKKCECEIDSRVNRQCPECFADLYDIILVEEKYCIVFLIHLFDQFYFNIKKVNLERWNRIAKREGKEVGYTPCLLKLEEIMKYWTYYHDKATRLPIAKKTTHMPNVYQLKQKARKLIKNSNIENHFLAQRMK